MRAGEESEREGDSDLIITRAASGCGPTAPVRVMGVNGLAVSHGADMPSKRVRTVRKRFKTLATGNLGFLRQTTRKVVGISHK